VIHLLRGQVYEIQGKTFFTMGAEAAMTSTAASWSRMIRCSNGSAGGWTPAGRYTG